MRPVTTPFRKFHGNRDTSITLAEHSSRQNQGSDYVRSLSLVAIAAATIVLTAATTTGAAGPLGRIGTSATPPVNLEHFVALTDDNASVEVPGCDAITIFDSSAGEVVAYGKYRVSPGQLAVTGDATLIVAVYTSDGPFIYVMIWLPDENQWATGEVKDLAFAWGAVAISPDDTTLLVAGFNQVLKYRVADVTLDSLGSVVGSATLDPRRDHKMSMTSPMAAAIEFTADSRTAYVVSDDGFMYTLDVESMAWREAPLAYAVTEVTKTDRTRHTFASLSPDERWLVINTGARQNGRLNVIELALQQVTLIKPESLAESWGVEFNYTGSNRGLLAVHGRREVGVYDFADGNLGLIAITDVPPSRPRIEWFDPCWARVCAMAWTGDGSRLIVRRGAGGFKEWRLLELTNESPRQLTFVADFDSCTDTRDVSAVALEGFDVVTLQDRLHRPTLTPPPGATPSPTQPPTATSSPEPSRTPTVTPTLTPTRTPSRVPQPIYLPLLLKEECDPTQQHADVALVIDASTSMREKTREGRTKLAAAVEAVELFLGELNLPLDQAAVVQFNGGVALLQELTGDRRALVDSLDRIQVKRQTRIDLGIQVAREELNSSRRRTGNQAVMIVLTDGKANPVGPDAAVREAGRAKDAGTIVFSIGLGEDLDLEALRAMASKPTYFYRAPDAEDLADIYRQIAVEIPCPVHEYWGQR